MAFANKRQVLASVTVSALLALAMITVAVEYFPSKLTTQSQTPSVSDSNLLATSQSTAAALATRTLVSIDPSNCHGNCTLNIPWPTTYKTLSALVNASALVTVANVTSLSVEDVNGVPVSIYNITVVQNLNNNKYVSEGSKWSAAQIGGTVNGTTMRVRGYPSLVVGGTYVFFLDYAGSFLAQYYQSNLITIGGPQGLYYVQAGKVYSLDNMYPQDDAFILVKAAGIPLAQFVLEVQSAVASKG